MLSLRGEDHGATEEGARDRAPDVRVGVDGSLSRLSLLLLTGWSWGPQKMRSEILENGERILLVDDEIVSLTTCAKMLEHFGYEVKVAHSGKEALEVFEQEEGRFDLVILDMLMPGMGGGDLFHRLREQVPTLKVLLMSGYGESEATEILSRGFAGFLQKPFTLKTLSTTVKEVIERD